MPIYYQIHRGTKISNVEKKFIKNKPFFFSKKNSFWYNIDINIGECDFNGYIIYKINIPKKYFTTSFNPKGKNKIVKINKNNIYKFSELLHEYGPRKNFIKEMNKRNIIGIDATANFIKDKKKYKICSFPFGRNIFIEQEGYIWRKMNDIKIEREKIVKL